MGVVMVNSGRQNKWDDCDDVTFKYIRLNTHKESDRLTGMGPDIRSGQTYRHTVHVSTDGKPD